MSVSTCRSRAIGQTARFELTLSDRIWDLLYAPLARRVSEGGDAAI